MNRAMLAGLVFLLPGFLPAQSEFNVAVPSSQLEAYVQRDGSVRLDYTLEVRNEGNAPLAWLPLSLPASNFNIEQAQAFRCDADPGLLAERGPAPAEAITSNRLPLRLQSNPDPDMRTDVLIDLSAHPVEPGQTAILCASVPIAHYVKRDKHCGESAYVSLRPTLLYGGSGEPADLYLAIHLPDGIDPRTVLGQQEWPQEEIQYFLPVDEENGQAVVRWSGKKPLTEITWIAAIFPGNEMQMGAAFDGLQTEQRIVPKEILDADVFIQQNGNVRVVYDLQIENTGSCLPVDSVQFVLSGRPLSVSAKVNDQPVTVKPYPDIYDNLEVHIGNHWYQAYNAELRNSRILPGRTGVVHLETVLEDEIVLDDPKRGIAYVGFSPTATARGYWQPGSRWVTRFHLPPGVRVSYAEPARIATVETPEKGGLTVITWEQTEHPGPMELRFSDDGFLNVQWAIDDPHAWVHALRNYKRFPMALWMASAAGLLLIALVLSIFRSRR